MNLKDFEAFKILKKSLSFNSLISQHNETRGTMSHTGLLTIHPLSNEKSCSFLATQ